MAPALNASPMLKLFPTFFTSRILPDECINSFFLFCFYFVCSFPIAVGYTGFFLAIYGLIFLNIPMFKTPALATQRFAGETGYIMKEHCTYYPPNMSGVSVPDFSFSPPLYSLQPFYTLQPYPQYHTSGIPCFNYFSARLKKYP